MDKTPLDDDKLDLTADHVHPITITEFQAGQIMDLFDDDLSQLINEALDYMTAENKDAVLVLTIKKD